jgi:hypothetical protein
MVLLKQDCGACGSAPAPAAFTQSWKETSHILPQGCMTWHPPYLACLDVASSAAPALLLYLTGRLADVVYDAAVLCWMWHHHHRADPF